MLPPAGRITMQRIPEWRKMVRRRLTGVVFCLVHGNRVLGIACSMVRCIGESKNRRCHSLLYKIHFNHWTPGISAKCLRAPNDLFSLSYDNSKLIRCRQSLLGLRDRAYGLKTTYTQLSFLILL